MMVNSAETETTFLNALYNKYCDDGSLEVIELPQNNNHKRVCEYVGFDLVMQSLKNVTNLRLINLASMKITSCDSNVEENFKLKKALSLDLSFNFIQTWNTVSKIVTLTDSLQELILTSNPLNVPDDKEIEEIGNCLDNLKVIVLGSLHYTWSNVMKCVVLWPNVEKLVLFDNCITSINISPDLYQNLKFMSLANNPLNSWHEIYKLGKLEKLEILELPNCKIQNVFFNDTSDKSKTDLFPNLNYLDLSNNQINDWRSVAELNKLKKLNHLLLKKNPLYDLNQYYFNFNYVISKIKNLEILDREPITKEMRNDGEKYYLRSIYKQYLEQTDLESKNKFLEENPCFLQILDKFGEPVIIKNLTKEEKIKQNYLILNICDSKNSDESKRSIKKQIPISTKVSNLKFLLRRLLKIDLSQDFNLIIESENYREEMQDRDDVKTYRLNDNSIISIERL